MAMLIQRASALTIVVCLTSALLWSCATAQEVEDESEFNYIRGSKKGPTRWGEIKKEWAMCNNGDMQSPIDLSSKRVKVVKSLGQLKRKYKPSMAILKNRGHDITIKWEGDAGSIEINGTNYVLQQAHWHSLSEHTLNGRSYDLEVHLVHQSSNPDAKYPIAVVGVFYKIGRPDAFLGKMSRKIKELGEEKEKKAGRIDPRGIKMGGEKYYRYMGSLTVPPCTEGVIWNINKKVQTVSREQVSLLRSAVHDSAERNARPIQPHNGRHVDLYDPNPTHIIN
ncbi:alpha carbonic anhydrase 7-like [Cucurbita pepo subsp. pepo]|uniref:alpha carbonic anhydrase 7-like n=1 Tax=Cucurbita pepo subsp. pepo TaxID=3664 RepID=UPI000C9D7F1D|nr:alpha carbonic anhydrase 7-like [Cucurbita pepo subsp. pepo]